MESAIIYFTNSSNGLPFNSGFTFYFQLIKISETIILRSFVRWKKNICICIVNIWCSIGNASTCIKFGIIYRFMDVPATDDNWILFVANRKQITHNERIKCGNLIKIMHLLICGRPHKYINRRYNFCYVFGFFFLAVSLCIIYE